MPELERWSGNDTSRYSIATDEFEDFIEFALKYRHIYLFGSGKIGSAVYKYLKDSGFCNIEVITSEDFDRIKKLGSDVDAGIIIGVGDQYFHEIMPQIKSAFPDERILIPSALERAEISEILSKDIFREKFWINVFVTNKCNLGCRSCSALAPLVKQPVYYDITQFKKDIVRIKEMAFSAVTLFNFTGAEAVLHPDIIEMISYARELFPETRFQLYTNGLFVRQCGKELLEQLGKRKVVLTVTEYPLPNLNFSDIYGKLDECNVQYDVICAEGQKYFSKRPFNIQGSTPRHKYINCPRYRMCKSLFLFEGRLYKCIYALSAEYVNEAVGSEMKQTPADYVDIYHASAEDVYDYATRRIPFCGYCAPIEEMIPWGVSERKKEEWL